MDPLFAAATLFDGYTDGVVAVTYGDKTSETSVDIECNTETG